MRGVLGVAALAAADADIAAAQDKKGRGEISRPAPKNTPLIRQRAVELGLSPIDLNEVDIEMPIECKKGKPCILHLGQWHRDMLRTNMPPKMREGVINNQKTLERIAKKLHQNGAMSCIYTEAVTAEFAQQLPGARKIYLEIMEQTASLRKEMGIEPSDPQRIYGEWSLKRIEYILYEITTLGETQVWYNLIGKDAIELLPILRERVGDELQRRPEILERFNKARDAAERLQNTYGAASPYLAGAALLLYFRDAVPLVCAVEDKKTNLAAAAAVAEETRKAFDEHKRKPEAPRTKSAAHIEHEKLMEEQLKLLDQMPQLREAGRMDEYQKVWERSSAIKKRLLELQAQMSRETDAAVRSIEEAVERALNPDPYAPIAKRQESPAVKAARRARFDMGVQFMLEGIDRGDRLIVLQYGSDDDFAESLKAANTRRKDKIGLMKVIPKKPAGSAK